MVTINKLYAGPEGDPQNSKGSDVANSVNGLVDNDLQKTVQISELYSGKSDIDHGHSLATTTSPGFISGTDKQKLNSIASGATVNSLDSFLLSRSNHTGTQSISSVSGLQTILDGKSALSHSHTNASTTVAGFMSSSDKLKLNSIETNATANSSDATLLDRSNHVGFQPIASITSLQSTLDAKAASVHGHSLATSSSDGFMSSEDKVKLDTLAGGVSPDAFLLDRANHTGTQSISSVENLQDSLDLKSNTNHGHAVATISTAGFLSASDKVKLDSIAANAKATNTDAFLLARANHTGTQSITTILGLEAALALKQPMLVAGDNISIDPATWTISSTGGGGGGGTSDHSALINRNAANQHTIAAITGLQGELDGKAAVSHSHLDATASVSGFLSYTDKIKLNSVASGATANSPDATLLNRANHTGTQAISTVTGLQSELDSKSGSAHTHANATTSVDGFMSATDKTKLNSVASGATANSTDAVLLARANHTGTQAISTVLNLQAILDAKAATSHTHPEYVIDATTGATDGTVGRVLRLGDTKSPSGDYRFSGIDTITPDTTTNLNSITGVGIYKQPVRGTNTNGVGGTKDYVVEVIQATSSSLIQVARALDTSDGSSDFVRVQVSGVWGTWRKFLDSGNLASFLQTSSTDNTAGKILTVGAFGLGDVTTAVTDLDSSTLVTGIYRIISGTTGTKPAGVTTNAALYVDKLSASIATQMIISADQNKMFFRNNFGSGWSAWHELWHSTNLVKQTSIDDVTAGSMLVNGAYGFGQSGGMTIPSSDLNNAVTSGVYKVSSGTYTNVWPGKATGDTLIVTRYSATLVHQLAMTVAGTLYRRTLNTTWGSWVLLWDALNLVKQTSANDATSGSVLTVGAGGLLGNALDTAATDANDINITGFFRTTETMANIPSSVLAGSVLANYQRDGSSQYQEIFEHDSDTRHYRRKSGGVWQSWRQIRLVNDLTDKTYIASNSAYAILRKDYVTRVQAICDTTNFTLTVPTGYIMGDVIELAAVVASGRAVTIFSTETMNVVNGTGGTSHTVTGPAHVNIKLVFDGTSWQLTVT